MGKILVYVMLPGSLSLSAGTKQSGQKLGDVVLPPWAKGSPVEFIRLHREVVPMYVHLFIH